MTEMSPRFSTAFLVVALALAAVLILPLTGEASGDQLEDSRWTTSLDEAEASLDEAEESEAEGAEENAAAETEDTEAASSPDGGSSPDASAIAAFSAQASSSSSASSPMAKLDVHGFLTQGYAEASFSDGRLPIPNPDGTFTIPEQTFDEAALGIPEDGTFDYRTLALQFRYEISPQDIMVIQLSNRALGESPISDLEEDVELDWGFYERRVGDNTSVKVGRVQIPLGIYNEIRDVGTILPFYRPPFNFYREGTFTSETVDGVAVSHTFAPTSDWALDLDVFGGEWETFELFSPAGETEAFVSQNRGYGIQLWLNTAIPGLRLGLGSHHRENVSEGGEGIVREVGSTVRFNDWYASLDGNFDRFVVRAEWREWSNSPSPSPLFGGGPLRTVINVYHAQFGYHINDKLRIYLQMDASNNKSNVANLFDRLDVKLREDLGLALNYVVSPNVVLKAEIHETSGEDFTFIPVFPPGGGFRLDPLVVDFDDGNHFILSLSASF